MGAQGADAGNRAKGKRLIAVGKVSDRGGFGQVRRASAIPLLVGVLASWGCGGQPAPPLPEPLVSYLRPASVSADRVSEGVWYRAIRSPVGPWAIHLLEVDLGRCELGFSVVPEERSGWGPLARVTEMLRGESDPVLAAVNGDFFTLEGRPIGPEIVEGRLRLRSPRPVFAWRAGADPWIGRPAFDGDSVAEMGWSLKLSEPDGATEAIGGFPELLAGGQKVGDLEVADRPDFARERHPRTAVGLDLEAQRLWLVVVDGRQEGWSAGMSLPELADFMEALGARDALNLDGGGSSVMVIGGRRVSRPSDAGGERAVVNALALREDPRFCSLPPGSARQVP